MSRRPPNHHQRRPVNNVNNDIDHHSYQVPVNQQVPYHHKHIYQNQTRCPSNRKANGGPPSYNPQTTIDIGLTSDATTSDTYYEFYDQNGFQHSPLRESRNTDVTFSDDSGSTRLPYFEFDDESNKRYSRTSFSDRSYTKVSKQPSNVRRGEQQNGDQQDEAWERLYQEIPTPCDNGPAPLAVPSANTLRRMPPSRLSDRPQSSMSSAAPAMVYGCGGKCQTFENICYFFLQLMFTMCILIGMSLCIAGLVLRNSAAKNLQVLIYIGVLLALVSSLLLVIQCRARNTARRRIKAIQMAKRAPIQMETLHIRHNTTITKQQQQMMLSIRESQRNKHPNFPQPHLHRPLPKRPQRRSESDAFHSPVIEEEQGIPWWRRKDLGQA